MVEEPDDQKRLLAEEQDANAANQRRLEQFQSERARYKAELEESARAI
jgi:hypothetical protein